MILDRTFSILYAIPIKLEKIDSFGILANFLLSFIPSCLHGLITRSKPVGLYSVGAFLAVSGFFSFFSITLSFFLHSSISLYSRSICFFIDSSVGFSSAKKNKIKIRNLV